MKAKAQDSVSNRWPIVSLGDAEDRGMLKLGRGSVISRGDLEMSPGDYPVYSSSATGDGVFGKYGKYMFDDERITWSVDGGGRLFYRNQHKYSVTNVCGWLKVCDEKLDTKFLYYALTSEWNRINFDYIFKAHPSVIRKLYKFPLPPLAEQKRIVAKLEKDLARVEALRVQFERMATAADNVFKATLAEEFAKVKGDKVRLGDVFKFIDYRGITPHKVKSGIPLITARNVRFGYMDYSVEAFITKSDYASRQTRGVAHKGDILFTTEAPLGFVAIADKETFSTGQRIITFQWLNDSQDYCAAYHLYYMMSDRFQDQIAENATGALAQGIKSSRLINLIELLPPLAIQREIVARLDAAKARSEGIAAKARAAVATCEKLRKAILAEAFQ